jgi:exoribonuclease R
LSVRFTKSVIASRAALTYAEAQTRIDDERMHDEVTLGESCYGTCLFSSSPSSVTPGDRGCIQQRTQMQA